MSYRDKFKSHMLNKTQFTACFGTSILWNLWNLILSIVSLPTFLIMIIVNTLFTHLFLSIIISFEKNDTNILDGKVKDID